MRVKLSKWAKMNGLSRNGAYNMFRNGHLPDAIQLPSGTILVEVREKETISDTTERNVIYARVSSAKQREDLKRQVDRLAEFCAENDWEVHECHTEVASGLNDNRTVLMKILNGGQTRLIVEHKDRLTRFGFNYIKLLLQNKGCEIVVVNDTANDEEDLMTDFISIITSMTARLYGLRRSKRKTERIINELNSDDTE